MFLGNASIAPSSQQDIPTTFIRMSQYHGTNRSTYYVPHTPQAPHKEQIPHYPHAAYNLQAPHNAQLYQQQQQQQQQRYVRSTSSRTTTRSNLDWLYASNNLINDMHAMTEDMRMRREQWAEEREQRQRKRAEAEAQRLESETRMDVGDEN
jgi:hypothetical protein